MTATDAIQALEALAVLTRPISRARVHEEADDILLGVLTTAGYEAVVQAYLLARERVGFWYA